MNGNIVSNGQPPPDEEREDEPEGKPDDKAGGGMSGELDVGLERFTFRASFRSWLMIAGIVAMGALTGLLKLAHAIVQLIGDQRK